jgi:hypothetical protein
MTAKEAGNEFMRKSAKVLVSTLLALALTQVARAGEEDSYIL